MRPRLGSDAKNAVLTNGECATAYATFSASSVVPASSTRMVMNLVAPSASRTIFVANSSAAAVSASRTAA
ncbi:hypothetical protein D3C78_1485410 [compost metagenome]